MKQRLNNTRYALGSLPRALGFLVERPRTWVFAMAPCVMLLTLLLVGGWFLAGGAGEALQARWLPEPTGWWERFAAGALKWVATAAVFIVVWFVSLVLTPPLSAPALEHLVTAKERELEVEPRPGLSFLGEMWCGLKAQAFVMAVLGPPLVLLTLVESPATTPVTLPLRLFLLSLMLAWTLFDYPLTLRGYRIKRRLSLIGHHPAPVLAFGLTFTFLFWFACCGVVMLPLGVVAATDVVWRLLKSEQPPEALPPGPAPNALPNGP